MTGFIKQLFRSKPRTQEVIEPSKPVAPPSPSRETGGAYFLDADAAKTFGNLDYMRSSRQIRHTFPKQAVGKDNASVKIVSATEAKRANELNIAPVEQTVPTGSQSERRKADSSMDMFRNMARDIKKS